MDKDVIITIKGRQGVGEVEDIELVTEGRLKAREGEGFDLSYKESALTGMAGTLTTFQIEGDRVTLVRAGAVNSQMIFEAGRRHMSMYETPYGALAIGVDTKRLHRRFDERGGDLTIDYAIDIDHAVAGENLFCINVREAGAPALKQ